MRQALYVVSFQVEPCHAGKRYHWMICRVQNPDRLVSWGHATTRILAEQAALGELKSLSAELTQGGHVIGKSQARHEKESSGTGGVEN